MKNHYTASVQLYGDKKVLTKILYILAHIRSYANSNKSGTIHINIPDNTDTFSFTVNEEEIPAIEILQKEITINID